MNFIPTSKDSSLCHDVQDGAIKEIMQDMNLDILSNMPNYGAYESWSAGLETSLCLTNEKAYHFG